ncbi:hypothetical protein BASA81_012428 [Batrachochytrium salamandrivorans]|nr:hypothetical protein BASA81_012428 [Batrachochytrium salamandrivorans]
MSRQLQQQNAHARSEFRVFVKNLAPGCTKQDVEALFRDNGLLITGSWFPDNGKFAFVDFDTLEEADRAVTELSSKLLLGLPLQVELSRSTGPTPKVAAVAGEGPERTTKTRFRLVATGLSQNTSWQDLKDIMRGTGGVVTFTSVAYPYSGVGYAEFATEQELLTAIEQLNGTTVDGKEIAVCRDLDEQRNVERRAVNSNRRRERRPEHHQQRRRRSPSPDRRRYRSPTRRRHRNSPPRRRRSRDRPSRYRSPSAPPRNNRRRSI